MISNDDRHDLEIFSRWEYDHKTNISNRINIEKNLVNVDKFASVDQITTTLKYLRFAHNIVFDHNPKVFFDTVDYTFRAIGEKTIDMKIFTFLMNTAYVISVQRVMNHIMTREEIILLLNMTNFGTFEKDDNGRMRNYFCAYEKDDMERMRNYLLNLIHHDLTTVTIFPYLKMIFNFHDDTNQAFLKIIDLAKILSTSCYLTKYSKACQALSVVSWVARYIVIDPDKLSHLPEIPRHFISPSRFNQFIQYLQISQTQINECCRDMQEFYIRYYTSICSRKVFDSQKEEKKQLSDIIIEENENDIESMSYHVRQLGYSFKPGRRLSAPNRSGDSHGSRSKSKGRLRNIRRYKSTTR